MKVFEHNGYQGSIEFDTRSDCLHGHILHIADMITYEATTLPELRQAFIEAVDDYLETCKELGIEPKKPFKGVFNVRMSPALHQQAAMRAAQEDTSLNDLVNKAVEKYLSPENGEAFYDHRTVRIRMFKHTEEIIGGMTVHVKPTRPVNEAVIIPAPFAMRYTTEDTVTVQ